MAAHHSHHASRPPLSSQQSSSVPSTPHQRARHDFDSRSRTPSPNGINGRHSPRSVASEANRSIPTISKVGRPMCKYETSYAFGRRRMQYDIGDAPLEPPKEDLKKSLDPEEDEKLSGDMRELYDRLLPSEDSEKRRLLLVQKLERILHKEFPGNEFKVHVFGSSGNMLCTSDSDVDICIQTLMTKLDTMHMLAAALDNNGMERVICVPAKVPIVKIWDPEFRLAADLNVNNTMALENTRMIKTYVQIDPRVRQLAMIIKHWTQQRILNDAGIGGTISSYAWICLILNFLQTRKPPILPSLHQRAKKKGEPVPNNVFDDDLDAMKNFGSKNKASIGQLLFEFFRYYGFDFKYEESVISIRQGRVLSRKEKGWTTTSKDGQWKLCIEEPFNISRNLGNSADSTAFRGIHLEIRRAYTHLCKLELNEMIQKYEFPPEEKSTATFKRPAPSKAVLSAVPSNSNKGKGNMRSNRNNGNRGGHSGQSFRRASSGAAFGRNNMPFLPNSTPLSPEFLSSEALASLQWAQNWQMLAQAQSHAAAHAHAVIQGSATPREHTSPNAIPLPRGYVSAAPSPLINNAFYPGLMYSIPMEQAQPMSQSVSQDGTARTNPSSPSLNAAVPARRGMQRASVSNGSPSGSIRSQSQPGARGLNQSPLMAIPIGYDSSGLPLYHYPMADQNYRGYSNVASPGGQVMDGRQEYPMYFVQDPFRAAQTQMPPPSGEVSLPKVPSHPDLTQRREHQPLVLGGQKPSRSPSPGHGRSDSSGFRSAPATSGRFAQQNTQNLDSNGKHPAADGLLIVNGSYAPSQSEESSRTDPSAPSPEELPNGYYFAQDPSQQAVYAEYMTSLQDAEPIIQTTGGYSMQNLDPSSTFGSPLQAFPAYVDPVMAGSSPLPTQEEEMVMSPKTLQQPPWQSLNTSSFQPSNSKAKDGKEHSRSPGSKSVSALGTVIETRTPSPSSNRKGENFRPVNGTGLYFGRQEPPPPTPASAQDHPKTVQHQHRPSVSSQPQASASGLNSWQQPSNKKRGNRKRSKSGPTVKSGEASSARGGEPLPARVEDRKGG